jgi:uncharacterized protein
LTPGNDLFDWDDGNLQHIARHDVTSAEAEQVILGMPIDLEYEVKDVANEERLSQLGATAQGRILQVISTWRQGKYQVISAWDAPKQLRLRYWAEMRKIHGDA